MTRSGRRHLVLLILGTQMCGSKMSPSMMRRHMEDKLDVNRHRYWRLGGVSNREIDFGFGCGAVRACVRAKLCAGVKGTMVPPGARPKNWKFVGVVPCRALPCPAVPAVPPDAPNVETKSSILPHFIASGYSAQRAVYFVGL